MLVYVINESIQPLEDTIVVIKEWIEIDLLNRLDLTPFTTLPPEMQCRDPFILSDDPDLYPEESLAYDMQRSSTLRMRRALETEDLLFPYTTLLEAFPDLDPTKVTIRTGRGLKFPNGIRKEVFNEEAARRGWHLMPSDDDMGKLIYPP